MVQAKTQTETFTAESLEVFSQFDALMATAAVDSQLTSLAESTNDPQTINQALSNALNEAQSRWGLGLHHVKHSAQLENKENQTDILLLVDHKKVAGVGQGFLEIAQAYAPMRSTNEHGLSEWGALPDGHRVATGAPSSHLKILIEEARDFETHWSPYRHNTFQRLWRKNDTLYIEVARPASAEEALADAAWDVITSIKDRTFQRELMRRSEEVGMLGALLAARHADAKDHLTALPDAHFNVQAVVSTLSGQEGRNIEEYRNTLKNTLIELDEYQRLATTQLSEVLKHGLKS